jgi:hypothetical protein
MQNSARHLAPARTGSSGLAGFCVLSCMVIRQQGRLAWFAGALPERSARQRS